MDRLPEEHGDRPMDTEPHTLPHRQPVSHAGWAGGTTENYRNIHTGGTQNTPGWPPLSAQKGQAWAAPGRSTCPAMFQARAEALIASLGRGGIQGLAQPRISPLPATKRSQPGCEKRKRVNQESYLTPYTEINSKQIKGLNARAKIIQLLGKVTGEKLCDNGYDTTSTDNTRMNKKMGFHQT